MIQIPKTRVVLSIAVLGGAVVSAWLVTTRTARAPERLESPASAGSLGMDERPRRVVSLIPAVTEILFALGGESLLVGRTRWGVHPPAALALPDVGDGVRPSLEAVLTLEPDLVLLYRGEANRGVAERLGALGVRTISLDHDSLADLERTIMVLGGLSGCSHSASELVERIRADLSAVYAATRGRPRRRVYYDAWSAPPITIGTDSFIDSLLVLAGADNVFRDLGGSAPRVSLEAIVHRDPDLVLVPVSPDSLAETGKLLERPGWEAVPAVAEGRVALVDQDLVSRLGPRVGDAAWALAAAIHPGLQPPLVAHAELTCRG